MIDSTSAGGRGVVGGELAALEQRRDDRPGGDHQRDRGGQGQQHRQLGRLALEPRRAAAVARRRRGG